MMTRRASRPGSHSSPAPDVPRARAWHRGAFTLSLASGVLLWAAFPPLGWWPLAWIAPLGWLLLIRRPQWRQRRAYVGIWLAGWLHWAAMVQGIRLAHPALYLGWLALSAYLAMYPVLFVSLTRVAVHRCRISVVIAAPVVWTGLELARGFALTGFSMALLGHTQYSWTSLIQIADVFGAYGVGFVIVLVSACLARALSREESSAGQSPGRLVWWPLLPLAAVLGGTLAYGFFRQPGLGDASADQPPLRVALIQGSFDTVFDADPERRVETFQRYRELSLEALKQHPDVDLIVWPESAFGVGMGDVIVEGEIQPLRDVTASPAELAERARYWSDFFRDRTRHTARLFNRVRDDGRPAHPVSLLVGTDTLQLGAGEPQRFNSALLVNPAGEITARYCKMHLVMFGEYLPFGNVCPWVYRLTPMTQGLTPGDRPEVFEVRGLRLAPSICFESTVPHVIRRHMVGLRQTGQAPDVLVNVTNDGWFWGSSILDFQLAGAVFRAVEHRRPMLVAANTGLSAWIDGRGRILSQGPRRGEAIILAEVRPVRQTSWYQVLGDWPAGVCLLFCLVMAVVGLWYRPWQANRGERLE